MPKSTGRASFQKLKCLFSGGSFRRILEALGEGNTTSSHLAREKPALRPRDSFKPHSGNAPTNFGKARNGYLREPKSTITSAETAATRFSSPLPLPGFLHSNKFLSRFLAFKASQPLVSCI